MIFPSKSVVVDDHVLLLMQILGCIIVGLVGHYFGFHNKQWYYNLYVAELFFLLISTSCLIATACLLISCLLSISTATIIAKTMFVSSVHCLYETLAQCNSFYIVHTGTFATPKLSDLNIHNPSRTLAQIHGLHRFVDSRIKIRSSVRRFRDDSLESFMDSCRFTDSGTDSRILVQIHAFMNQNTA